uniref:Cytochrome P450 n=1 Tax=Stomoxys calcitrans TaxID=35570 RepID=A0A1I8PXK2_STOCA
MFIIASIVIFISLFFALYVFFKIQFSYWSRYKTVPSVAGKIFSGNFWDFLSFKTNFAYHLKTIYDDPKFADTSVVGVYGLYKPCLLIREPELIKSVLVRDFDSFHNRFGEMDVNNDPVGAHAMFFATYPIWKEMRTKLSPLFTSVKMKNTFQLIRIVAENLNSHLNRQHPVYRVEMKDFCARYMIDIVATTLLGFQSNCLEQPTEELNNQIRKLSDFSSRRAFNLLITCFVPKLAWIFGSKLIYPENEKYFRQIIPQAIAERESSGKNRSDLIDFLVKVKKDTKKLGKYFMECLIAQAAVFIVAGFETSSSTMSNALLELAKNPDIQKKLKQIISSAFSKASTEGVTYEDIDKIEYLDMIISETLRLYPAFPALERVHNKPTNKMEPYNLRPFCDYSLPDGMSVFISTYGINYDPKYWPNPTKFDPERFSAENYSYSNSAIYLPFGMGPRNCIGMRLGIMQVKCGLLYLLKDHHVRICEDTVLQPEFDAKSIVLQIKGGINLEIVRDEVLY